MHVDIDDIQTTRGEKLLALVMTAFLLIGGIWAYDRLEVHHGYVAPVYTPAEQAAISANDDARQRLFGAQESVQNARGELEISREAYRTELDAGRQAPRLAARYREAQRRYAGVGTLAVLPQQSGYEKSHSDSHRERQRRHRS